MFTDEEIEIILDALDAWENQPSSSGMLMSLLGSALIKDEEKAVQFFEKSAEESSRKSKSRRDRVILIKAKIVQMKNEAVVQDMFKVR